MDGKVNMDEMAPKAKARLSFKSGMTLSGDVWILVR